jgi:MIP family channel proteins
VQQRGPSAYIAEFVGTFALVLFITMAVSLYVVPGTPTNPTPFIDFSVIGLVHVFVLFMLISTLAVASGAHFNPAVTVAMAALRQISPADAGIYIVTQLAGGVAGALVTKALLLDEGEDVNYGALEVSAGNLGGDIFPGMIAEGIGTFFLVWVIVGVAVNPNAAKDWAALAIGATLGLGVMVIAPLTGAGFNPARAFGPALVSGEFGGADVFLLVYVLAPVVFGVLAAIAYFNIYIAPGKKGEGGMEPVG